MTRLLQRGKRAEERQREAKRRAGEREKLNTQTGRRDVGKLPWLLPTGRPLTPSQVACRSQQHGAGCSANSLEPKPEGGDGPI